MSNPWEEISLHEYESHMSLESIMQLQTMNKIMLNQLYHYSVSTVMILGIAGGNGLNHIDVSRIKKVYGVDINKDYLHDCIKRYPKLKNIFQPILCNLLDDNIVLPKAELVIANLFIEYVGYEKFKQALQCVCPRYVSIIIQINNDNNFVSNSPYSHTFDCLEEVHQQIDRDELIKSMREIQYSHVYESKTALPNGRALLRIDFEKV